MKNHIPKQQPHKETPSEQPTEKDLDQLYSALRYKAKKGDANPLDKYSQLKTRGEKHDCWKMFKADKAFNFVNVQDENSVIRGNEVAQLKWWMTKFQIGDHEQLPVDHPLMVSLVADLPSRQGNNTS